MDTYVRANNLFAIACCLFALHLPLSAQTYFQQQVDYTIHVKLNDAYHELKADETIIYTNNSPTPLSVIYMHLWANAYRDNTTCLAKQLLEQGNTEMYFAKHDDFGYIDSLDFKINNKRVRWEYVKDSNDICKLFLEEELKPGENLTITTPFHVKIPSATISRLGHIGQSYMISQWYPKPAVYDKNGWNYMPYLNQGEFYSEFGSYDVSITLPGNYVVGATGDMVDAEREIKWLDKLVEETKAIKEFDKYDMEFPSSDYITKTIRFKQNNVHDFAWFADKRYHVLKGEVVTPHTNHKVTTWAMFTNAEADLWTKSIGYINDAIHYYSLWNGDYPYNNCTAVDGTISAGGGMEYPNITVIGTSYDSLSLDIVITHEVGHNWFYGMLGSNERVHPWMDEGINTYNECRYVKTKYPKAGFWEVVGGGNFFETLLHLKHYKHKTEYELGYWFTARTNEDQPIELPAYEYSEINFGSDVYYKTAISFDYLRAYLGDTLMDKAMQRYFDEWHYKHPTPADFRKIMEETTGKELGWFFDDLINSTRKLDYKLCKAKRNEDGTWRLNIKNTGSIAAPLFVQAIKNKKVVGEKLYPGFAGEDTLVFPAVDASSFKIDYEENMPEINRNNNTIRTRGLFKKVEPIQLQFLGSLDNPDKTQLFYTPIVGWNEYNKGMVGMAFYNNLFPQKKFEFQLMPMYSFAQKDLAGSGRVLYRFRSHDKSSPNNNSFHCSVGITGMRYDYSNEPFAMNFNKIAPELLIELKQNHERDIPFVSLRYRYINIIQDSYFGKYEFTPPVYGRQTLYFTYHDLTFNFNTNDAVNPFGFVANFQNNKDFNKISLTQTLSFNYKNTNKSFDIRLFAGTFIGNNKSTTKDYRYRLSGQRGYQDYLYDNIYLGRSETDGALAAQFTDTDGAFKFYSPVGQTNKWIVALNLKSSLGRLKIPINLYADIGTTEYDGIVKEKILYDAGVSLSIRKKILEIYFPLVICDDFKNYKIANDLKYQETIRFTLNINLLNPFDLIKDFKL